MWRKPERMIQQTPLHISLDLVVLNLWPYLLSALLSLLSLQVDIVLVLSESSDMTTL